MNFKPWLDKGLLQKIEVTEKTLDDLLKIAERDLTDSQIEALSTDRRFATAYGAALNLVNYVIRKQGYKVPSKSGHHQITFEVAAEILDGEVSKLLKFFDLCRRKRNKVDYDFANVVSETEVAELLKSVKEFKKFIIK